MNKHRGHSRCEDARPPLKTRSAPCEPCARFSPAFAARQNGSERASPAFSPLRGSACESSWPSLTTLRSMFAFLSRFSLSAPPSHRPSGPSGSVLRQSTCAARPSILELAKFATNPSLLLVINCVGNVGAEHSIAPAPAALPTPEHSMLGASPSTPTRPSRSKQRGVTAGEDAVDSSSASSPSSSSSKPKSEAKSGRRDGADVSAVSEGTSRTASTGGDAMKPVLSSSRNFRTRKPTSASHPLGNSTSASLSAPGDTAASATASASSMARTRPEDGVVADEGECTNPPSAAVQEQQVEPSSEWWSLLPASHASAAASRRPPPDLPMWAAALSISTQASATNS
mmetsp:Transcript_106232/g.307478  ORF Transcript_106232/g.307478 Transcript_106232/m.307478 type:complete len:342 (+) Transcript_106232:92-1117(+)